MVKAHADAIKALMDSIPHITWHDGAVPDNPALPYVVLWTSAPRRFSDSLKGDQRNGLTYFHTTTVALDPDGIRIVQGHVHDALTDARLDIPGYKPQRIQNTHTQPITPDRDVTPAVLFSVDQWQFITIPA